MPTLRDLLQLIEKESVAKGSPVPVAVLTHLERVIRQTWPAERVYVPPAGSRKDAARNSALREAAKRLPVGVVADRNGVTPSWVYRLARKK